MPAIQLAENVFWVGVKDPKLAVFDIVMKTDHGTTYNAYVIKGRTKTAVIDTVKAEFSDEFFANLGEIIDVADIDYLVVNHNEPDHSGGMIRLLEQAPKAEIICSMAGIPFVKNTLNREAKITGVKDNHTLDLGGKSLHFKVMPYMHWPDTLMEFLPEDKILFSNDGFAAHYSFESLWADEATIDLDHEFWYYYDAIMRPFTGYMRRNLPKLNEFDVQMIAPSHGPIFRRNARKWLDKYVDWAADRTDEKNQVMVVFASNYGNTRRLADVFIDQLKADGLNVVAINAEACDLEKVRDEIEMSRAILFGTPTFAGDAVKPIWDVVGVLHSVYTQGKKAAVFGSYGWGGEGTKLVADRLAGMKLKVYPDAFRVRLVPSDDDLAEARDHAAKVSEFIRSAD